MDADEKRIRQEDCNEDSLGVGILTLTNKRIAFDKKESRVMDFSASMLMKKICFTAKIEGDEKTYKFGVFNNGGWRKTFENTLENFHAEKTGEK